MLDRPLLAEAHCRQEPLRSHFREGRSSPWGTCGGSVASVVLLPVRTAGGCPRADDALSIPDKLTSKGWFGPPLDIQAMHRRQYGSSAFVQPLLSADQRLGRSRDRSQARGALQSWHGVTTRGSTTPLRSSEPVSRGMAWANLPFLLATSRHHPAESLLDRIPFRFRHRAVSARAAEGGEAAVCSRRFTRDSGRRRCLQ
jgi:hypothetical protein